MNNAFSLVQEIMSLNFAYDTKYQEDNLFASIHETKMLFEYDNYLKPLTEKIIPHLYTRHKAGDDLNQYYKLIKVQFLPEVKKELAKLEADEKNFEINLKRDLVLQMNFLHEDLQKYNKGTETDKNHQKIAIEDFFTRNKANFLIIIKAHPELGLSLVRDSKIIHLQFLFFSNFGDLFKKYFYTLNKKEEFARVFKTYFYYSPIDLKKYYQANNLLALDDSIKGDVLTAKNVKINIRLIKHFLDEKLYLSAKEVCLKNNS